MHFLVDSSSEHGIMTPEEIAQYLRKSLSWVYKNWQVLGGVKLGGSLFFPRKEDLYERLFGKVQGVEVRLHPPGHQAHGSLVQDQKRIKGGRGKKKAGVEEPASRNGSGENGDDPNRHGIWGTGEPQA